VEVDKRHDISFEEFYDKYLCIHKSNIRSL